MSASQKCARLGDQLSLHYKLSSPGGEIFEDNFDAAPLQLKLGEGEWAASLEQWLIGLPIGERHVFSLELRQAFGHADAALIQTLARSEFPAELTPKVGALMEFQLPNGTQMPGVIKELRANEVVVDFNHPLSDCPLLLEVEILEIMPKGQHRPPDSP